MQVLPNIICLLNWDVKFYVEAQHNLKKTLILGQGAISLWQNWNELVDLNLDADIILFNYFDSHLCSQCSFLDEKQIIHPECTWRLLLKYVHIDLQKGRMNENSHVNLLKTNKRIYILVANCQVTSVWK